LSQSLSVGNYNVNDLTIGNDALTSLKVPFGLGAQLFWDFNFGGPNVIFEYGEYPNIGFILNDQISSIKVLNRTVLYLSTDDPGVPSSIGAMFDGIYIGISSDLPADGSVNPVVKLLPGDKDKRYFKFLSAAIPEGQTFTITETTQNGKTEGNAGWAYSYDPATRMLNAVAFVKARPLFGTRNWIGVEIILK
jgi:hypothetical protein